MRFFRYTGRVRIYSSPAPNFVENPPPEGEAKTVKPKYVLDAVTGQPIPLSDGREEVFAKWRERDLDARTKAQAAREAAEKVAAATSVVTEYSGCSSISKLSSLTSS